MLICLFSYVQQLYAYMYLALDVNTRKTVFHSESEKILLYGERVFHGHDSSGLFGFYFIKVIPQK